MSVKEELYKNLLIKKKKKGLEDLLYFNKYILESDKERRNLLVPHVHGEWWSWYKNSDSQIKMILVPRGCFKSTFFTVGRTIQALCQNRDHRILIANSIVGNSQKFLGEIKEHLRKNERLISLYGDFYDKDLKWNENEIEIKGRSLGVREPSVTTTGVGGSLVSQHYSMIICDDLVGEQNSATRYLAEKTIDWWKRSLSLLDYDGEMVIIGTRWAYYELYSHLLETRGDKMDVYIRGAYNKDGSLYFPELLSEEKLKELREDQGSYIFSSFYLNDPVDEDSALIKKSQIRYYGEGEEKKLPSDLVIGAMCDPAVSQKVQADESSIIIVGVDWENNWYVLETKHGKWTVSELIEKLFETKKEYSPVGMTIEVIGLGQALLTPIHDEEDARDEYLPLKTILTRPQIKKESRIRSILQPRFERGKIFIKRDMVELEDQLLKFPRSKRDDMIDALADTPEVCYTPPEPEKKEVVPASHLEALIKRQAKRKEDPGDPTMGTHF